MEPQPATGKILNGVDGMGTPTPEMVEERALQHARMDGRTEPNEADRILARGELVGTVEPQTPEVDPEVEDVTVWDESPTASGAAAPKILPEDEANMAIELVEEGLEEADHDQRVSSVESNPPEEEEEP